jgi:hypothetical protein
MDKLIDFISSNLAAQWSLALIILQVLCVIIWKACAFYFTRIKKLDNLPCTDHSTMLAEHKEFMREMRTKSDNLPCTDHSTMLAEHKEFMREMRTKSDNLPCTDHSTMLAEHKEFMREMRTKSDNLPCDRHDLRLTNLTGTVNSLEGKILMLLMQKGSPYRLTKAGLELLKISGGDILVDKNIDFFINAINEEKPRTAFDAEMFAKNAVKFNLSHEIFDELKNFVYCSPAKLTLDGQDIEVDIYGICAVMGIYLRDRYLERYPELIPENFVQQVDRVNL